ncbi:hypothetical protein SPRG_15049 [Saprolegnia parasitica CBS 223.65]|uniref:Uncharacterized protein n=1 Tax=Saprolegnia parasitica (strain CBS 223.65) TaxID=695850 RepID=A0A067BZD1_SAPPC|nr:hypothetical protein SPRG_15049 [Saprolegnia parasitica CBS 223.65]KDO19661.1 hypothetical protein SPRG_15049 [Saprolegnia parasitica CBS 223.65]|eukprot:XP_012209622.1 hypothetical protein SPRG_15049 [Saprolegnia parasitica CBS 223.65]
MRLALRPNGRQTPRIIEHDVLGLCLVLDAYVAANGVASHWLHGRLPPLALATIDAALDPPMSVAGVLLRAGQKSDDLLFGTAAPALAYGLRLQRRLSVPALTTAMFTKLLDPSTTFASLVATGRRRPNAVLMASSVLTIALQDGALTSALLERCRTVFGSCTVPAIRDVLAHDKTVDDATRALLHLNDYYRDHPHPHVAPSHDIAREVDAGWRLAVDTRAGQIGFSS